MAKKKAASKKKAAAKSKKKAASKKKGPTRKAQAAAANEETALARRATEDALVAAEADPMFADVMGSGNEEVTADDMSSPFLNILQFQSPPVMEDHDLYVEDAAPGDFMHSVTRELWSGDYDEDEDEGGILVVPAHFIKRWIEWIPRAKGGGFVRQYEAGEAPPCAVSGDINLLMDEEGQLWEGKEKEAPRQAVLTHLHYLLVISEEDGLQPLVFSVSGTQLTPSGKWNTLIMGQRAGGSTLPRFSTVYRLTTNKRQKDDNLWYVFAAATERRLAPSADATDLELFNAARGFKEAVMEGDVVVDHGQQDGRGGAASADEPPAAGGDGDGWDEELAGDDTPF